MTGGMPAEGRGVPLAPCRAGHPAVAGTEERMEAMREETQAEEQQIVQERAQSEARLASLAVLQRPIRELLPTLPPAVALGHQEPVRHALELMRQKQLSCVLVVEHGPETASACGIDASRTKSFEPDQPKCAGELADCDGQ